MTIIKNIIFDLGGVILNIDYNKTEIHFKKLGANNFGKVYSHIKQISLIDDFDIGKITAETFRETLKTELALTVNDEIFDQAWNAMLLDLPSSHLNLLKKLSQKYRLFLFSNTNEIHLKKVMEICASAQTNFADYFEKTYYSNIFKKRKPNPHAFIAILDENHLKAEETLFIDDSIQHVLGAKAAGIHAMHLSKDKNIFAIESFLTELENS